MSSGLPDPLRQIFEAVERNEAVKRNLREVLEQHGITFDDAIDLCSRTWLSHGEDNRLDADGIQAVGRLHFLHGFSAEVIAGMTDVPTAVIAEAIVRSPRNRAQTEVMTLHLDGYTPVQIERETGVRRTQVYRWLEEAGHHPNRRNVELPDATRTRVVEMYKKGATYPAISARLDITESQVSTALRQAHRSGQLPQYGERWAV